MLINLGLRGAPFARAFQINLRQERQDLLGFSVEQPKQFIGAGRGCLFKGDG